MPSDSTLAPDGPGSARAVQTMFAGSNCLGLFVDDIESIAEWRIPTPIPGAPAAILGVVCIKSRMLTVLDANVLLGQDSSPAGGKLVILQGDEQIALAIDQAGDMIEGPVSLAADKDMNPLILGCVEKNELPVSVLDATQLFATAMRGRERRHRSF